MTKKKILVKQTLVHLGGSVKANTFIFSAFKNILKLVFFKYFIQKIKVKFFQCLHSPIQVRFFQCFHSPIQVRFFQCLHSPIQVKFFQCLHSLTSISCTLPLFIYSSHVLKSKVLLQNYSRISDRKDEKNKVFLKTQKQPECKKVFCKT